MLLKSTIAAGLAILFVASPGQAQTSAREGRRLALLVGINKYRHQQAFRNLDGAVNDVEQFRALLVARFGFAPEDVLVLTDEKATQAGIVSAFRSHLVAKATAADAAVFYYAGHGSQVKDASDAKGYDTTIVPADSRDPEGKVFDITAKELRLLFGELLQKTKDVTSILDSCHSGTTVRGAKTRSIPLDNRPQPQPVAVDINVDRGIVAISGARPDQESREHTAADGSSHGALSYFLAQELLHAGEASTWRDVMDRVRVAVTARYPSQEPQLEGVAGDKFLFGRALAASQPYFTVTPGRMKRVQLNAGEVHGATAGSVFEVFPPGTKKFAKATPIAKVQVTQTSTFMSDAEVLDAVAVPAGARAIERQHRYPEFKLRVYFHDTQGSAALAKIQASLAANPVIVSAPSERGCDLQVRQEGQEIVTLALDGTTLSPPIAAGDEALLAVFAERMKGWARWFNLLDLDSSGAPAVTMTVTPATVRADSQYLDRDTFRITFTNGSETPVFINLINLSSDGSVTYLPTKNRGTVEVIAPGKSSTAVVRLTVAEGRRSSREILKMFATNTAVDFSGLEQGAVRSAEQRQIPPSPLNRLLASAASATARGAEVVSPSDWSTAVYSVVLSRP